MRHVRRNKEEGKEYEKIPVHHRLSPETRTDESEHATPLYVEYYTVGKMQQNEAY